MLHAYTSPMMNFITEKTNRCTDAATSQIFLIHNSCKCSGSPDVLRFASRGRETSAICQVCLPPTDNGEVYPLLLVRNIEDMWYRIAH